MKKIIFIIIICCLLYAPALNNYFSSDDWYHLRLGQINSIQEFLNFFSFTPTPQTASFYRPLSTQVFFFIMQKVFGLWPLPWYLITNFFFGLSIYLVYLLTSKLIVNLKLSHFNLSKTQNFSLLTAFFYGFSVTHFTHLYFLSTFQEILMVIGINLAFIKYLQHKKILVIFFWIIALLSKETAIVLPALIVMYELIITPKLQFSRQRILQILTQILPLIAISFIYIILRFQIFVPIGGDSYVWDFSPIRAINTFFWYTIWSIGVPEMIVDFIGSGFQPIPRFYTAFGNWWIIVTIGYISNILLITVLFIKQYKQINKLLIFGSLWFAISLSPFLFLPWHKFSLELGLPMIGFAIILAWLIFNHVFLGKFFLIIWIIFNLLMNIMTYQHHYTTQRSIITHKVTTFFQTNYPKFPNNQVWFTSQNNSNNSPWGGEATQVAHSINRSELFKVLYNNHDINVYFQGIDDIQLMPHDAIQINANQFLKQHE